MQNKNEEQLNLCTNIKMSCSGLNKNYTCNLIGDWCVFQLKISKNNTYK